MIFKEAKYLVQYNSEVLQRIRQLHDVDDCVIRVGKSLITPEDFITG